MGGAGEGGILGANSEHTPDRPGSYVQALAEYPDHFGDDEGNPLSCSLLGGRLSMTTYLSLQALCMVTVRNV